MGRFFFSKLKFRQGSGPDREDVQNRGGNFPSVRGAGVAGGLEQGDWGLGREVRFRQGFVPDGDDVGPSE